MIECIFYATGEKGNPGKNGEDGSEGLMGRKGNIVNLKVKKKRNLLMKIILITGARGEIGYQG